jgi:hypothetical protein
VRTDRPQGLNRIDPERTARAVFTLMSNRGSEGDIENVKQPLLRSEFSRTPT